MFSAEGKTRLRVLFMFLAIVWVIVGLFYGWPVWLWLSLAGLSLIMPWLIMFAVVEWQIRWRTKPPSKRD